MRKLAMSLLVGTLSLGGISGARADEKVKGQPETKHESVTLAELPPAARAALEREAQGGKIEELHRQTSKDRKVSYEAEIVRGDKGTDVEVSEKGMVLSREKPHDERVEPEHHDK
jgi:hypothetical protein